MNSNNNEYLANGKIGKLMVKFSLPCIISLLVSSLYNIVDQIFIGRGIGFLANGATNVVFPITILALSVALMIGDGCAAFLSISQGRKDQENIHRSIGNATTLLIVSSVLLTIFFTLTRDSILVSFGATENNIDYAKDYFDIVVLGIPFFVITNGLSSVIRSDGSPKFAMLATLVGCVINLILDPIAIFVLKWGVSGAAIATVVGQGVSAILVLYYLFHTKSAKLKKSSFVVKKSLLANIVPLGISSFLTQLSIVVIMGIMNTTLVKYGALSKYGADIPITVVGIVMKVFQIVIALVVGIAAGSQPIVGYNYGAKHYSRVKQIFKYMMISEIALGIIATICFEFFPLQIIGLFGSENALYNEFAIYAFRIFLSTIILTTVVKSTSIFLQSMGKPVLSLGLSLLRDFILSVPLILILPKMFGIMGPLFSAPIADIITLIVTVAIMFKVFKSLPLEKTI